MTAGDSVPWMWNRGAAQISRQATFSGNVSSRYWGAVRDATSAQADIRRRQRAGRVLARNVARRTPSGRRERERGGCGRTRIRHMRAPPTEFWQRKISSASGGRAWAWRTCDHSLRGGLLDKDEVADDLAQWPRPVLWTR
ncbi:hypothetical protein CERSUDRAFT_101165 [Gelatoporia subvermispora B]|uniref:Uncharacterized protein n=1 Tax=Ceriporiopsis subvermispora (strain B) TaxID=914234 RepID=M2QVS3_CERS8|nr:hypothetical protein CERSUDRAFT_101165 [Gelatoporia subvermispora B]